MAKKEIIIEIPNGLEKYPIRTLSKLLFYFTKVSPEGMKIIDIHNIVSIVSGLDLRTIGQLSNNTIKEAFGYILAHMDYLPQRPKKEITIKGITYFFDQDLSNSEDWTGGRYIDADNRGIKLEEEPEYLPAICYVEKGKKYGDVTLSKRAEIMKTHFKGTDFLDLNTFFLDKSEKLKPGYLILQAARSGKIVSESLKHLRQIKQSGLG